VTSIRHRLLIDECLPPTLISAYLHSHIGLSGDGVDAVHICKFLGSGKKDQEWVPKIARDQRWCVLSKDKGSKSTRRDALPLICYEREVTLILISEPVIQKGITFYGPQLLANWPSLVAAMQGPKGAQYLLRLHRDHERTSIHVTRPPEGYWINKRGELVKDLF